MEAITLHAEAPHPENLEGLLRREVLEIDLLRVAVLLDDLRLAGRASVGLRSIPSLHITCRMSGGG